MHGKHLLKFSFLVFALCCTGIYCIAENNNSDISYLRIIKIMDGDSFEAINDEYKKTRLRLFGIDCPEYKQDFSQQAKNFAAKKIFGKKVLVQKIDIDRYGREIVIIKLEDEKTLNEQLIEEGLCRWYQRYAPNHQNYQQLEESASKSQRGIWSIPNNIAPWTFREQERMRRKNFR